MVTITIDGKSFNLVQQESVVLPPKCDKVTFQMAGIALAFQFDHRTDFGTNMGDAAVGAVLRDGESITVELKNVQRGVAAIDIELGDIDGQKLIFAGSVQVLQDVVSGHPPRLFSATLYVEAT